MKPALLLLMAFGVASAATTAGVAQSARQSDPEAATDNAEFANQFNCPDPSAGSATRRDEAEHYREWVHAHHSDWTKKQAMAFRVRLLEQHHCEQALQELRSRARARSASSASN